MTDIAIPMATNLQVVAETPGEMAQAQQFIINWCNQRIATIHREREEAQENFEIARKAKWRSQPWRNIVTRCERRLRFYEKVKLACQEGYYIIPPFWGRTFAIRVKREKPIGRNKRHQGDLMQSAQTLPAGEGRYVSPDCLVRPGAAVLEEKHDGTKRQVQLWNAWQFQDVEFPVTKIKPAVLTATKEAMAKKIFDKIDLMDTRGDPIVAGAIYNPAKLEHVCFHISWWLDLERI